MVSLSGVTSQKIEPVTNEISRIEPVNPVKVKASFERTEDRQAVNQPIPGLEQLNEQDMERMQEELEKHNEEFAYTGKTLKFKFDEEAAMLYVEVLDATSQEVIVSLPPEFLIDLSIKMKKILGLYIDEKL